MLSQLVCKRWYSLIQSVDTTINTVPTFPALMGPPSVGEHSSKRYTTVVDRKFIPHMPAVLLQIKFISKGHWTCRQSIPCVNMTLEKVKPQPPPHPYPLPPTSTPIFYFSLHFLWSYCTWEVWNGTWRFMVAYHFCIDQIFFFFFSRYDLCNMWQMWNDTGHTSWWHIISALIIELSPRYLVL